MVGDVELHDAACAVKPFSVCVRTTMPFSATGVVQEAGVPRAALDLDQAEPAGAEGVDAVGRAELRDLDAGLIEARMTEVPAGTVTLSPSIVRSPWLLGDREGGVP
jgi:hypothetical protein